MTTIQQAQQQAQQQRKQLEAQRKQVEQARLKELSKAQLLKQTLQSKAQENTTKPISKTKRKSPCRNKEI